MPSDKVEEIEPCLSIQEDIKHQEKGWKIQRIATYIIFGLVILIAAGLFGNGPLAHKTVKENGVVLTYERFVHHNSKTQLDIYAPVTTGQTTVIAFPLRYLDHFGVETVVPEPVENRINGQEILYTFNTSQTARITFFVTSLQWGRFSSGIKVNGQQLPLSYFTYP